MIFDIIFEILLFCLGIVTGISIAREGSKHGN